ncbi:hypothetical protein KsCSTR_10700 [Candidatus Kuenenia stuttgartiensis]|uniref:Uncharacterized protein n=1 Tax=Kuenenia stuttgartiensis TaxID=174633 RepID=Q1PYN6_KUEST|nr:hypothetical protein KsCSTR_10700 [Candidatus Kuenenia stuttgartiensis]CAJ72191.1 unknown protein [Candidatus Kuenenia stuttgartiensis]
MIIILMFRHFQLAIGKFVMNFLICAICGSLSNLVFFISRLFGSGYASLGISIIFS